MDPLLSFSRLYEMKSKVISLYEVNYVYIYTENPSVQATATKFDSV
jgi:hypothetical protein